MPQPIHETKILFIHGFMGDEADWRKIIDLLPPEMTGKALTLPGHLSSENGLNDPPEYDQFIAKAQSMLSREIVAGQTVVAAYSMGGRLALKLFLEKKIRPGALILESVSFGIRDQRERQQRAERDRRLAKELAGSGMENFLRNWMQTPLFGDMKDKDPQAYDDLMARRQQKDPRSLARWLRDFSPGIMSFYGDRLADIDIPVLCLTGGNDQKYMEIMNTAAGLFPKGRFESIPGCGHNCHFEDALTFTRAVTQFIREI